MSSDEYDPLNIGKVEEKKTETIPMSKPRFVTTQKFESNISVDLFKIEEKKERRKSLRTIKVSPELLFGSDSSSDLQKLAQTTENVPMRPVKIRRAQTLIQPSEVLFTTDKEDFTKYIDQQSIGQAFSNQGGDLKTTRKTNLERDKLYVQQKIQEMKNHLNIHVLNRSDISQYRNLLIVELTGLERKGLHDDENWKSAIYESIKQQKIAKFNKIEAERYRTIISRLSQFLEWLDKLESKYPLIPLILTDQFINSLEPKSEKAKKLQRQIDILQKKIKPRKPAKPNPNRDWYFNAMHPDTESGKIIGRFEDKIAKLKPNDIITITVKLDSDKTHYNDYEQLLFDIGWQHKPYPFGISRARPLPKILDLFPAVIAKTDLDPEYAYTSFNILNGMQWPFKSAVDMIFDMMILTNPYKIASVFWDIIQETAQCMKKILVINKGIDPDDVEIDFDSLFPLLEIIILVFGNDEWTTVALYTMSFNEQVADDPQLQFAMTYLEGLVTQLMAIDVPKMREKAARLKNQWLDQEQDPLGVHN